jgi:crotonobetainyl-CoA:carnitine CoA-transferase CaiB-like acyl-CoA transferase
VLDLSRVLAGPWSTMALGDLGAEIWKIENPDEGDETRSWSPPAFRGSATYYLAINRNKSSLALDFRTERGQAIVRELAQRADVLVENYLTGTLARYGLDYPALAALNPRLIYCSISGYGRTGTLAERAGYDFLIQAESGFMSITGEPDGAPQKFGLAISDLLAGDAATQAILAALYARERTGVGAAISISMFDVISEFMGFALQYTRHTGEERQPNGMSTPMVAPYGGYPTSDGQTVVLGTTNDREWQRLALQMLERPDLAADPRFATNIMRCVEREVIDEAISAWTRQHPLAEIQSVADAAGIGNSRYNTVKDVINHAQLTERNRWQQVESPVGPLPSLLAPPESEHWRQRLDGVPALGQHTDSILGELGYSSEQIAQLRGDAAV